MDDLEFDARKLEAMRPLMFETGAALWDCQGFEFGLALLLYHLARLGVVGLDAAAMKRILDNDDKQTAGQLIGLLRKHTTVGDGIETALGEGLKARNLLIHRVLIDNVELFMTAESRAALVKKIRAMRRQVKKADKAVQPFIVAFSAALDDEHMQDIQQQVRDTFP
jgi:hypothetical protein